MPLIRKLLGVPKAAGVGNKKRNIFFSVLSGAGLFTWGNGGSGVLGLGSTANRSSPSQVGSLTNWSQVAGGGNFSMATKTDGTLWSWGANTSGSLGLGNNTAYSSPKQIGALTNWLNIAGGSYHTVAVKTDGTLWIWGMNGNGQLGLGNLTYYSSPKQVGALTVWSKVAAGASSTFAIKTDGTLWSWGSNANGVLGLNFASYTNQQSSPNQVGALTTWLHVGCGLYSAYAIKTDGTFWVWGRNTNGRLGLGNITEYISPKQLGALTNWSTLSPRNFSNGSASFGAIKTDGTLWMWGSGLAGQLGLGNTTDYSSPKQVGSLTTWLRIVSGYRNAVAIKTDGSLWSWGYNPQGQLGLSNTTYYSSPKQVGTLYTWYTANSGRLFYMGIIS